VQGDLLVFVPEASRAGKQVVSKAARAIPIDLDPAVRHYFIEVKEPTLEDATRPCITFCPNGELVLGNKDQLICSSCATGPALEGAQIEFGMRAAPGAVSSC